MKMNKFIPLPMAGFDSKFAIRPEHITHIISNVEFEHPTTKKKMRISKVFFQIPGSEPNWFPCKTALDELLPVLEGTVPAPTEGRAINLRKDIN